MNVYQVKTEHRIIYWALVSVAREHGWTADCTRSWEWLTIYPDKRDLSGNHAASRHFGVLTIPEAIRLLETERPIEVAGYPVQFTNVGVQIGPMFMSTQCVNTIHERLHRED